MNKLRLGIIGPGLIWGITHEKILLEMNDFYSISAFSASSNKSQDKIKQQYPGTPFYHDYHELLKSPDIDAVVIMTPIPLNAQITKAALQAGKIVFVEKPFCTTVAEGTELLELHNQSGLPIFILEQVVYRPTLTALKQIIADGTIGKAVIFNLMGHFFLAENIDSGGFEKTQWRQNPEFPLGTLMDGGIHDIAKLSTIFGTPTAVTASGCKLREGYGEYDHISMAIEYGDGLRGTFSHSAFMPNNHLFHLHGTEATVIEDSGKLTIKYRDKTEKRIVPAFWSSRQMWKDFKQCLQQTTQPEYSLEQAVGDIKTLVTVSKSIKSGRKEIIIS